MSTPNVDNNAGITHFDRLEFNVDNEGRRQALDDIVPGRLIVAV